MRRQLEVMAPARSKRFDPNVMIMPATTDNARQSVGRSSPNRINPVEHPKPKETKISTPARVASSTDSVTSYLEQISSFPLLRADEEAALARRVQQGDLAAREQMIRANLRLVVRIASGYQGFGLPLCDLISEGNIGLMRAVDRFNPDRGARLSTYAGIWIKQSIRRAIGNYGRTIRLPVHVVEDIIRMKHIASRLEETLGREPDDAELAGEMKVRTARVKRMRQVSSRIISLDAPLDETDEEGQSLSDLLSDEQSCWTPAHELERNARLETLRKVMRSLAPREQSVLRYRFGLKGGAEHTLEAIGKKLGLTRERIRQIERTALKKLRRRLTERDAFEATRML